MKTPTIIRTHKKFTHQGFEFSIVTMNESYLNGGCVDVTRIIAPNGKQLPLSANYRETIKSIHQRSIILMNDVIKRFGIEYFINELDS